MRIKGQDPRPAPTLCPQLVAGIKYFLTMEMGSTDCRKTRVAGDHVDLTTCPLAAGAQQEVTAGLLQPQPSPEPQALRLSSLNWFGWTCRCPDVWLNLSAFWMSQPLGQDGVQKGSWGFLGEWRSWLPRSGV